MRRSHRERVEAGLKEGLDIVDIRLHHVQKRQAAIFHPWQHLRRTFLIIGFFNVLFGPTLFGVLGRYRPDWGKAVENFFTPTGLAFIPIFNTVIMPLLIGFIEMAVHKCCRKLLMPELNARDTIPFIFALPVIDQLSHKLIGDTLSLSYGEAGCLIVSGAFFQILQATVHSCNLKAANFLDFLFHDPIFTFLGQYFVFGKLLPKIYRALSNAITQPINRKAQSVSDAINERGFHFFECARPRNVKENNFSSDESFLQEYS